MTPSIDVSEETKAALEALQRDDETLDELLGRLATEYEAMEDGAWAGSDRPERAREAIERSRDSFEQWTSGSPLR